MRTSASTARAATVERAPPVSAAAPSIEHAPPGAHDAPLIEAGFGESHRRFVVSVLAGAVVLMAAVATFGALMDPYGGMGTGAFPTVVPRDATVKADLIEGLRRPPGIVVLGSSRSLKMDPRYLHERTGQTAFNAGVRAGTPVEAYAMLRLMDDRFHEAPKRVLWMLDVEAFRSDYVDAALLNDHRIARYFSDAELIRARTHAVWPLLSWDGARDALKVAKAELTGPAPSADEQESQAAGFFRRDGYKRLGEARDGKFVKQKYTGFYAGNAYPELARTPLAYFEESLRLMKGWKTTPVIVITPMSPKLQQLLGPLGWNDRRRDVVQELKRLKTRYRFELLDLSSVETWGGSPRQFADGVHLLPSNMQRLTDTVLARFPRAFQ
ncbi:MAG: hypothetical protein QOJ13_352 [Gaiellales bacterium]|jgi:hypothetical protein|nr:hypothetical protein [Gaiellales bacterium]